MPGRSNVESYVYHEIRQGSTVTFPTIKLVLWREGPLVVDDAYYGILSRLKPPSTDEIRGLRTFARFGLINSRTGFI